VDSLDDTVGGLTILVDCDILGTDVGCIVELVKQLSKQRQVTNIYLYSPSRW